MNHVCLLLSLKIALLMLPMAAQAREELRDEGANLLLENVPAVPAELADRLRQRQELSSASFLDWAGDDTRILIGARAKSVPQIHISGAPRSTPTQLTFSEEPLHSAVAQPRGDGFTYTKDGGGDEHFQLYYYNLKSGETTRLTKENGSRNLGAIWSKDGTQLAYLRSPPQSSRYQIRVTQASSLTTAKTIFDSPDAMSIEDWSPDGQTLLVSRFVSMNESYIYLLSLTGNLREINSQPKDAAKIAYNGAQYPQFLGGLTGGPPRGGRFSKDGRSVYVISDQDSEFARLTQIDLRSGARTTLSGDANWDVESFDLAPDGSSLIYSMNEGGISKLYLMNTARRLVEAGPSLPLGVIGNRGFDQSSKQFAFTFFGTSAAAQVYVWDLATGRLSRWTESSVTGIDTSILQPKLVRFPTFDKREISAYLYEPKRTGKHPVIIHVHGGPETQYRPTFTLHPYVPVVSGLSLGFAVIAPNVRGSTGYGKTFLALDNGMRREDAVRDIGALLDWIAKQPSLDKDRVVIHGASYGGYLVNASMVHFPDRLKAGVSIVAISDFLTYLKNTADYRRDLRRVEYGDERIPAMAAFLELISPLRRAGEISSPMFIIHGANDPRVPVTEAEQLFTTLKTNHLHPWLMIAKDEGHGFQKQANIARMDEAVSLFLQQIALDKGAKRKSIAVAQ
jgi:dipeptidyl aminopeptidase/acylaminoacyl peptidase